MQHKLEGIIREQNFEIKRLREEKQKSQKIKEIQILDTDSINDYETIENIDNDGQVVKVCFKKLYALKNIKLTSINHESFQNFINDLQIINMINHPNVLKTFKVFYKNENSTLSILLEYCQTNLEEAVKNKNLTKAQIVSIIIQVAKGMKFIHLNNIIHGNLKPTNVLFGNDGQIKIADLGLFKLNSISNQNKKNFTAPEKFCSDKADVYSFGCLIYFMLSEGNLPVFNDSSILQNFSAFSQQLINKCWHVDPQMRPSFKTICEELDQNKFDLIKLSESENQELQDLLEKYNSYLK